MKTETTQILAIVFAIFALAEFWSKVGESRKAGYCAAAIYAAIMVAFCILLNIGSIIYGTK